MPSIAQILRHGPGTAMSHALSVGWALAALGLGYASYGWRGVVLAVTVVVFWLLLQLSRALRVLREAGSRPVGTVANAVMLQARLQRGMRLPAVLRLTGSLGRQADGEAEAFVWQDDAGDEVLVRLSGGKVQAWQLRRAPDAGQHPAAPGSLESKADHPNQLHQEFPCRCPTATARSGWTASSSNGATPRSMS